MSTILGALRKDIEFWKLTTKKEARKPAVNVLVIFFKLLKSV